MVPYMATRSSPRPNPTTVRERVREALGGLTPSERRVARVLLVTYPLAGLESITELAERAQVSEPTVTRFVAKTGFDGYRDFQREIREEVQAVISSPLGRYPTLTPPPDPRGLLKETFDTLRSQLDRTLQIIPAHDFEATVELAGDLRRHVWCTGGRWSHVLAYYLFSRLHQLRPGVHHLGDGPTPRYDALLELGRRHVVVVFDYRRYQPEIVDFAHYAAERGATIVLVTDRWLSPVAGIANHVLPTVTDGNSAFDSMVAGLGVVEALIAALLARLGDGARERLADLDRLRASFGTEAGPG
jgi:DNA-binding MurR/RpiR family transcriptional regulator